LKNAADDIKYIVYQEELAPTTGQLHLQGYCMFNKVKTLAGVKKVSATAHWEMRKGTHEQAVEYCKKAESRVRGPWERGAAPAPGKRNDLLAVKVLIDNGATELEIAENATTFPTWCSSFKAFERYKRLKTAHSRDWMTRTVVYYGPPGTGKTRRAMFEAGPNAYWVPKPGPNQTAFFDGYDGQEHVVIDEFYGWLPFDTMCRMCDRYPLMVNTKGGMVSFYPKQIWITSNAHPANWYKNGLGALERRLTEPNGEIVAMLEGVWAPPAEPEQELRDVAIEMMHAEALAYDSDQEDGVRRAQNADEIDLDEIDG